MKKFLVILFLLGIYFIVFVIDNLEPKYRIKDVIGNEYFYINNKLVEIKGVEIFPLKNPDKASKMADELGLAQNQITSLAYISEKYLIENFKGKYATIKNDEIFYNNIPISTYLSKNGLAYKKGDKVNLRLIKKRAFELNSDIEYFIFDKDKEILHKNNCKSALNLKNYDILRKFDLFGEIKKCPICFHKPKPALKETPANKTYPPYIKKESIILYLNNPYRYSNPSTTPRAEVCRALISEINNAKKLIYFSIYGIDGQNEIINALINAKKKGIDVKGVSDSNAQGIPTYYDMNKFKNIIDITYDKSPSIMHNKFFVIDDDIVISGSMNISKTGCGGYNSNSVLLIKNKEVNSIYKKEFLQMFEGKFKTNKVKYFLKNAKINGKTLLSVYFAPSNIYTNAIQNEIKNAKHNIRMSIFVLTYTPIADELITAKNRKVNVRVIADAVGAMSHSRLIKKLRENGIPVKIENWGGKNHEKTISIDDNVLIMGSANFSYAAFDKNDENLFVIKDSEIVKFYNGFFDNLFSSIPNIYLTKFPRAESFESINSCTDGIDNNFDGKIDKDDIGCKKY